MDIAWLLVVLLKACNDLHKAANLDDYSTNEVQGYHTCLAGWATLGQIARQLPT